MSKLLYKLFVSKQRESPQAKLTGVHMYSAPIKTMVYFIPFTANLHPFFIRERAIWGESHPGMENEYNNSTARGSMKIKAIKTLRV